jgi:hypothetical protein
MSKLISAQLLELCQTIVETGDLEVTRFDDARVRWQTEPTDGHRVVVEAILEKSIFSDYAITIESATCDDDIDGTIIRAEVGPAEKYNYRIAGGDTWGRVVRDSLRINFTPPENRVIIPHKGTRDNSAL